MTDLELLNNRLEKIEKQQGEILDILKTIFSDNDYISYLARNIAEGNMSVIKAHNRRFASFGEDK